MSPHALKQLNTTLKWVCATAILASVFAVNANVPWPNKPLATNLTATPMTMLIAGRDHKLFYEAYNDASDIDGDGRLDIRFKPAITYYGLYDSTLCYSYSGPNDRSTTGNTGLFSPSSEAGAAGTCSGATEWSGNWLNYVTTSRMDALRKVLYGGFREIDTDTQTILRRSYIPQIHQHRSGWLRHRELHPALTAHQQYKTSVWQLDAQRRNQLRLSHRHRGNIFKRQLRSIATSTISCRKFH